MNNTFEHWLPIYSMNDSLKQRQEKSVEKLKKLRGNFENNKVFKQNNICIYAVGSLGRLEVGKNSDLDVFLISEGKSSDFSRLKRYQIFSELIQINEQLGFPEFSNDGRFLNIYGLDSIVNNTGDPQDDSENTFTARILLLLESEWLFNEKYYDEVSFKVCEHYFRDEKTGRKNFKPLYLLNDLLRYWRTLCLNYEQIRNDMSKPWHKKNINLKFARRLTVFSLVAAVVAECIEDRNALYKFIKMKPLHRIQEVLKKINDRNLSFSEFGDFATMYSQFLDEKEKDNANEHLRMSATIENDFKNFLYKILTSKKIKPELKVYLIT